MQFEDRISAYPNRYIMTDENGNSQHVVIERADEPTVAGTPLNAETFNKMVGEINVDIAKYIYPVGSQYVASSPDVKPADLFGGTWELVDKGFRHKVSINVFDKDVDGGALGADGYETMCYKDYMTKAEIYHHLAGNVVRFRMKFYLKPGVTFKDVNEEILVVMIPEDFGFTQFSAGFENIACYNDSLNSVGFLLKVPYQGSVWLIDILGGTREFTVPSSLTEPITLDFTTPINKEYMLDEFCDKFYWKRTA